MWIAIHGSTRVIAGNLNELISLLQKLRDNDSVDAEPGIVVAPTVKIHNHTGEAVNIIGTSKP